MGFDQIIKFDKIFQKHRGQASFIPKLSFKENELIIVISSILNMKSEKLAETIENSLSNLFNLKQQLSMEARDRFEIKIHNALPFGSAIIIDGNTEKGKIQIETSLIRLH